MPENTLNDTIQSTNYTVTLEEQGDDLVLPIPDALMDELGWEDNTMIEWSIEDDHIVLRKVDGTIWISF